MSVEGSVSCVCVFFFFFFFFFFSAAKFHGKEAGVGHEKGNILSHIPCVFWIK